MSELRNFILVLVACYFVCDITFLEPIIKLGLFVYLGYLIYALMLIITSYIVGSITSGSPDEYMYGLRVLTDDYKDSLKKGKECLNNIKRYLGIEKWLF